MVCVPECCAVRCLRRWGGWRVLALRSVPMPPLCMSCDLGQLKRQIPTGCCVDRCSVKTRAMSSAVWLLLRPERLCAGSIVTSWIYAGGGEDCDVFGVREVSCECAMMLCWLLGVVAVLAGPSDGSGVEWRVARAWTLPSSMDAPANTNYSRTPVTSPFNLSDSTSYRICISLYLFNDITYSCIYSYIVIKGTISLEIP